MSGLDKVDGKRAMDNATTFKGGLLKIDKIYTITCFIRGERIDVLLDGKPIINFKGDFAHRSLGDAFTVPNKKELFLHAGPSTSFRVDHITVKPVKGTDTILK